MKAAVYNRYGSDVQHRLKAAIYTRCAASNPNEDRIGPQIVVCEQLAEQHEFIIVKLFSDRNISGSTASRSAYQEMLFAARQHDFEAILAEDISRFWRNDAEMSSLLAELDGLGIAVLTERFDSRNTTCNLALMIVEDAKDSKKRQVHGLRVKRGLDRRRTKQMEDNQ